MARINPDDVEAVRERTDVVALIGQHVSLKKSGQSFSGLCPFHTEKTASFNVNPDKGLYYCYGCGKGGDAIHFVMEVEGLTFPEAVERLAGPAGVTLRYEGGGRDDRRTASRRDALLKANATASELYHRMLLSGREGEEARRYVESRGITKESIEAFGIGYAPGYSDFLLRRMTKELSPEILEEAGLTLKDSKGGMRDRFRARVTFPIDDLSGRTLGFGARLLEGDGPKYMNTNETSIYRKSELLYNLHRARQAITSSERAFVVEGYTDVIALAQGGVLEAVATCGTAVGEGHFTLLSRFARRVVLSFDSDEAGARAAERAYALFERFPLEVLVLVLPEGLDPADLVLKHGPEEFVAQAEKAVPLVEFMLRRAIRGHDRDTPEGRARAVQAGLPIVTGLDDPVRRDQYAGMLADLAGVSSSSVLLELQRHAPREEGARAPEPREPAAGRSATRDLEREALKLLAQHAPLCAPHLGAIADEAFETNRHRRVFALLVEAAGNPASILERAKGEGLGELVSQLAVEPLTGTATSEYAESVFARLEELLLSRRIATVRKALERLNPTTQPDDYDALFEQLIGLESERRRARGRAGEGT
ncbi:MAG TPA: DNA primase [Actinomycetota bacterium]